MVRGGTTLVTLVAVTALLAGACSGSGTEASAEVGRASSTTTPTSTTTVDDLAAEIEQPGDWAVGVREATVTGARGRVLPVEIWYPVDPGNTDRGGPATYPFPGFEVPSALGIANAPVAPGPFPLVVYSHGNGGLRYVSAFLCEHLASHGFVVVAPGHAGNTAVDAFAGTSDTQGQVALDRPLDVSATIDAALAGDPGFEHTAPSTDPEKVAVIGHSFGGFTALAVAGGFGAEPSDQRVDAVVGMAAATGALPDSTLEGVDVPTLLLWATDDTTVGIASAERPDELIPGRPYVRADLSGAQHQSFTDVCAYAELVHAVEGVPTQIVDAVEDYATEGCLPGQLPIDEAHRIIKRLTTAFLLEVLWGDDTYSRLLDPETGADPTLARLESER